MIKGGLVRVCLCVAAEAQDWASPNFMGLASLLG